MNTRRTFLQAALATGAAAEIPPPSPVHQPRPPRAHYPRIFTGRQLKMIAFPLGGVGAGSLSLGGRGQLRDWEIFNRPNKGYAPNYAFPSIWAQVGAAAPVARVLESRILPPYEGQDGLGSGNVPGLVRLASAQFTGEYPLAKIDFEDHSLPVKVSLEAFSPFIPHDAEDSGLPVAVLRYRVANANASAARVSIAFSIENPIEDKGRETAYLSSSSLAGLVMTNPALGPDHPMRGEFALTALTADAGSVTHWRGWPEGRWWNSPMLFWDEFSARGSLGPEPDPRNAVGALCLQRAIPPRQSAEFTFLLAWRFPNRTPEWCGWDAPRGGEKTIIGNHYSTRFPTAWDAALYAAGHLTRLEARTRLFAASLRQSTLPPEIKEAASANLSTLASTTCFRTADGEFHGFEGVHDKRGCCFGNCTHVWNYETSTAYLFPSLARSLRKAAFGYSMDDAGAMHFRQLLPEGKGRSGFAAADGQMGQILHAYLDWNLSGDLAWLRGIWPRVKKGLEFAWTPGGWDANRDGVLEGVQHNTYDVEFYGPNPQCGIYYLGALRAGEEMARAVGDNSSADEYRRLFEQGRQWIDTNLFNGQFYVQKVRGFTAAEIAPNLRSDMGSANTEHPEYQVGEGCLVDQLVGQYLAEVAGLGSLVDDRKALAALHSIYTYNYKRTLASHECVQRTFALNDEAAIVICDYGKAARPHIPFPYYAEVMTGFEYSAAALMLYRGMIREGVECIGNIRARYDGEKRNPWDEAECGHHYARAMAAWSGFLALSGFRYHGPSAAVSALPPAAAPRFHCFWSTATGWGTFTASPARFELKVLSGHLACQSCEVMLGPGKTVVELAGAPLDHEAKREGGRLQVRFSNPQLLEEGDALRIALRV